MKYQSISSTTGGGGGGGGGGGVRGSSKAASYILSAVLSACLLLNTTLPAFAQNTNASAEESFLNNIQTLFSAKNNFLSKELQATAAVDNTRYNTMPAPQIDDFNLTAGIYAVSPLILPAEKPFMQALKGAHNFLTKNQQAQKSALLAEYSGFIGKSPQEAAKEIINTEKDTNFIDFLIMRRHQYFIYADYLKKQPKTNMDPAVFENQIKWIGQTLKEYAYLAKQEISDLETIKSRSYDYFRYGLGEIDAATFLKGTKKIYEYDECFPSELGAGAYNKRIDDLNNLALGISNNQIDFAEFKRLAKKDLDESLISFYSNREKGEKTKTTDDKMLVHKDFGVDMRLENDNLKNSGVGNCSNIHIKVEKGFDGAMDIIPRTLQSDKLLNYLTQNVSTLEDARETAKPDWLKRNTTFWFKGRMDEIKNGVFLSEESRANQRAGALLADEMAFNIDDKEYEYMVAMAKITGYDEDFYKSPFYLEKQIVPVSGYKNSAQVREANGILRDIIYDKNLSAETRQNAALAYNGPLTRDLDKEISQVNKMRTTYQQRELEEFAWKSAHFVTEQIAFMGAFGVVAKGVNKAKLAAQLAAAKNAGALKGAASAAANDISGLSRAGGQGLKNPFPQKKILDAVKAENAAVREAAGMGGKGAGAGAAKPPAAGSTLGSVDNPAFEFYSRAGRDNGASHPFGFRRLSDGSKAGFSKEQMGQYFKWEKIKGTKDMFYVTAKQDVPLLEMKAGDGFTVKNTFPKKPVPLPQAKPQEEWVNVIEEPNQEKIYSYIEEQNNAVAAYEYGRVYEVIEHPVDPHAYEIPAYEIPAYEPPAVDFNIEPVDF